MAKNSTQRREVNIGAGMDTSAIASAVQQITGSLKGLTAEISQISRASQGAIEPMQQSFKKVAHTSGLAGAAVMGKTGIIQDSNYGMRGMANNIQFVVPLLGQLVATSGSVTAAFRSLWSAMMGPLGIMMVFSTGITILERFSMQKKKAAEEANKAAEAFGKESAQAQVLFGSLESLITNNGSLSEIKKATKQINETYNTQLNAEKLTVEDLNVAYQNVIKSIKAKMAIAAGTESIEKGAAAQTVAEIELNKLNTQRNSLIKKRSLLNQAITSQAEKADEYTADIEELNTKILQQEKAKQEAINQQNIGLHAIIEAQKKIKELGLDEKDKDKKKHTVGIDYVSSYDLAQEQLEKDNKEYIQAQKDAAKRAKYEVESYWKQLAADEIVIDLGEIEDTGETFGKVADLYSEKIKKLGEQIKADLQRYVVDVIVSIGEMIGGALVSGLDSFKAGKDILLKNFADFLGKFGALLIAWGVANSAFWESISKPSPATASLALGAGIAAVVAAGAIKAYLNKSSQGNPLTSGGVNSYSGGYSSSSNNDMYIYSRLDGRDLVLSNQRSQYQIRR